VRIKITFAGSFQCRLATDPDDTWSSPNEPAPDGSPHGTPGKGWTFAYYEPKPFDRVIRLSDPKSLRSAMVDPWEDTRVTLVEASRSLALHLWPITAEPYSDDPLVPVVTDYLMGKVVSFGQSPKEGEERVGAKFASATPGGGTGDGHEVLDDFAFSLGGMLFIARQAVKTKMTGINYLGDETKAFYKQEKTALVKKALGTMHPARAKLLSEYYTSKGERKEEGGIPRHIQNYASFFAMAADLPNMPLYNVQVRGGGGVVSLTQKAGLVWKLSLNFSRFDGDTLTGKVKGVLAGSDSRG
jgi:hypothetical protein